MAIDDPTSLNASIIGRIRKIEDQLGQLSAAPLGKVKPATAGNFSRGFSWAGAGGGIRAWITVTAPIVVPPLASKVSLFAMVTSVVCSNAAAGVAAFSYVAITIPELNFTQDQGSNVFVASNTQQQRARTATVANLPVTPGQTLTVTAQGDAFNTGTNADNYLAIDTFALFQY